MPELPEGWALRPVKDVARVVGGGTPSTKNPAYWDGDVPWITPKDLSDHQDRYISGGARSLTEEGLNGSSARVLPTDTVLVSSRAPVGYVAIAARPLATNQGFRSLVLKDGHSPEFFYYLLKSNTALLESRASGSTFKELSGSSLKGIEFPIPPPAEQERIADVLGALDRKIEANRRMNATLDALARVVFRERLGRYSPGDALPDGWTWASIYDVASVVYGAPFKSKRFNDEGRGLPLIRIRDLRTHAPEVYTDEEHPKGTVIEPGDIVVGMDGEFRAHVWTGLPSYLNQRVCQFAPKPDVPTTYVRLAIERPLAFYERAKTGTTVIHLGKKDIDTFKVPLPPPSDLEAFERATAPLLDRQLLNARQNRTLTAIRDRVTPALLSGMLRVDSLPRGEVA